MEKLYLSAPSCVQDNVDFSGFLPPGAAVADPEKQPGFRQVVTAKYCHEQYFPSRPGAKPGLPLPAEPDRGCTLHPARGDLAVAPPLTPAPQASAGSLGRYAKSSSPTPVELGLAVPVKVARGPDRPAGLAGEALRAKLRLLRVERFRLLSVARSVFIGAGQRAGLEHAHNFHRTAKCKAVNRGLVSVNLDPKHKAASFGGLVTCGSVWTCPVCSVKIQERRRAEIQQGIDWAYASGFQPVMVTLTFPHGRHDKLGRLLEQQADALRRMRGGKQWVGVKEDLGYQGLIRSLEVTLGENGWHPHVHELWMLSKHTTRFNSPAEEVEAEVEAIRLKVLARWEAACVAAGLLVPAKVEDFRKYGIHVKGWCSAGDYLAKQDDSRNWGVDREMAKATSKAENKVKGLHPFALLAKVAGGDRRAGRLFLAYALAIKGKRQLFWSPGLKARVGLGEKTDEQLAEEERENADVLGLISSPDWHLILRQEKRAAVLDAAELGGWPAVLTLVESLRRRARIGQGPDAIRSTAAPPCPG